MKFSNPIVGKNIEIDVIVDDEDYEEDEMEEPNVKLEENNEEMEEEKIPVVKEKPVKKISNNLISLINDIKIIYFFRKKLQV